MKRKNIESNSIESNKNRKKIRNEKKINTDKEYVSGTMIRNYMINDSLVDWLNLYLVNIKKEPDLTLYLLIKGQEFERSIVNLISKKFPVVYVSNKANETTAKRTIELMKNGTPIIHSAPVYDKKLKLKGVIDLLVRSDYINKLTEVPSIPEENERIGSSLNDNYHYIVIDIKYSTIPLNVNDKTILNSGNYPAYKGQTLIYTKCINEIQGYFSPYSFILGRGWKSVNDKSTNSFNRLGMIDFIDKDRDIISKTENGIKWIRNVYNNGNEWKLFPPSRPELYPNLCVDSGKWNDYKKEIAYKLGDISLLWNCGVKHRDNAIKNGVTSWRDVKCNSELLGLKGNIGKIVDRMITVNTQHTELIYPITIKNKKLIRNQNELFVDFETISNIFDDFSTLPLQNSTELIFMIGVGWETENGWNYKSFTCDRLSMEEELRILTEFLEFMKKFNKPLVRYWYAEKNFWNRAKARHNSLNTKNINIKWSDFSTFFKKENIVIKGCFSYKLKDIAENMEKNGMITVSQKNNIYDNGIDAMYNAWKYYSDEMDNESCSDTIKNIEKYNDVDCKILYEMIKYFRNYYL